MEIFIKEAMSAMIVKLYKDTRIKGNGLKKGLQMETWVHIPLLTPCLVQRNHTLKITLSPV